MCVCVCVCVCVCACVCACVCLCVCVCARAAHPSERIHVAPCGPIVTHLCTHNYADSSTNDHVVK